MKNKYEWADFFKRVQPSISDFAYDVQSEAIAELTLTNLLPKDIDQKIIDYMGEYLEGNILLVQENAVRYALQKLGLIKQTEKVEISDYDNSDNWFEDSDMGAR